jgi:dTDP-4-dehydrorhamnose reductase
MKMLVIGSGGRLGAALQREYAAGGSHEVTGFTHAQLDLADGDRVRRTLDPLNFDLLINAAAFTNVDLAEKEKEQAFKINEAAPEILARVCHDKGVKLIHFSTDYVFDGENSEPCTEEDEPRPLSVYGASKLAGEHAVLSVSANHIVARVSWVFGPDRPSFVDQMIGRAREHDTIAAVADKWSTPTYTRDIAQMLLKIIVAGGVDSGREKALQTGAGDGDELNLSSQTGVSASGYSGILHIANAGQCTWQEYAQHALDCCRNAGVSLKATNVGAIKMSDMKSWIARRPVHTVLSTGKYAKLAGMPPRSWQDAVAEYVHEFVAPNPG